LFHHNSILGITKKIAVASFHLDGETIKKSLLTMAHRLISWQASLTYAAGSQLR
jgi:hypothetical protein